jgi:N-acyl-D-aspartate/D-glutamate deacylase
MGFAQRAPTPDEAHHMAAQLDQALDAGAFGLSTGLIYAPSVYADTAELTALARVTGRRPGRLYTSHIRGEGPTLEAAIAEAIRIGDDAGLPVQISHLKACLKANWPKMGEVLRAIETARAGGIDVTADMYPYTAGSTTLASLLPVWVHEGGMGALLGRLADTPTRRRILEAGRATAGGWGGPNGVIEWADVMIAECGRFPEIEGRTMAELASARGAGAADVLIDLVLETEGRVSMNHFLMLDANVARGLQFPHVTIGSDNLGLCAGPESAHAGKPHPRQHGCFPKILGTYVRERGVLSWETAVHKMTGQSAQRLGLPDRGVLRPGAAADVVVFDPETVADLATYQEPHRYPAGIRWVWVNGGVVLGAGRFHARPTGRVLSPAR